MSRVFSFFDIGKVKCARTQLILAKNFPYQDIVALAILAQCHDSFRVANILMYKANAK